MKVISRSSSSEEREMRDYEVKILKPQINVDERRWQKR